MLLKILLTTALSSLVFTCSVLAKQPNLIVFLTDDQGWGDLSSSGNTDLSTPSIDSLKTNGVSFNNFYVCPVCSPTRAEFLTGRYYPRTGVYQVSKGGERINLDEVTIADLFKKSGYATGAFGKWHNGTQYPYHPNGRGFDEFYGFCSGHWGNYFTPILDHNGSIVKGKGFCIDDFTNKSIEFIERNTKRNKPFFAYIPYNTPHSPMQVPDEYWNRFKNKKFTLSNQLRREPEAKDNHKRCALAMCENIDWNVGRILKKLHELKVTENTIIVWFHDNGPNGIRWNGGMRGHKGSTDEGGCRSPLYIQWDTKIKPSTEINHISSARDLLPTLCELAGVNQTGTKHLDGRSLKPLLENKNARWKKRYIINHWQNKVSVRTQQFRLDHKGSLYDMSTDPGQQTPVNQKHLKVTADLKKITQLYRTTVMENMGKDNRPFILTHPDSQFTQLPARDAKGHGNIEHSSRHPNSSYMRGWKTIKDKITYTGEVMQPGFYEVHIYYASRVSGGSYQVSFKDEVINFSVDVHNVPEIGEKTDRFPRIESYEKNFKKLKIGTIKLKKGIGEFTISATKINKNKGIDLRLVTLKRIK